VIEREEMKKREKETRRRKDDEEEVASVWVKYALGLKHQVRQAAHCTCPEFEPKPLSLTHMPATRVEPCGSNYMSPGAFVYLCHL